MIRGPNTQIHLGAADLQTCRRCSAAHRSNRVHGLAVLSASLGDKGQGGDEWGVGAEWSAARPGWGRRAHMHTCTTTSTNNVSVQHQRADLRHATGCGECKVEYEGEGEARVSSRRAEHQKLLDTRPSHPRWAWPGAHHGCDKEDTVSRAPDANAGATAGRELGIGAGAIPHAHSSDCRSCRPG